MMILRHETASDVLARETLLDAAFGADRHEKTCERLREGRLPHPGLAFVAEEQGEVIGTVRLWAVKAGDVHALLLGPLAVAQAHRGRGLGARLMRMALTRAAALGHGAVILVGDPAYYERFGFAAGFVEELDLPGPVEQRRFLGLELKAGALAGARGPVVAEADLDPSVRSSAHSAFSWRVAA